MDKLDNDKLEKVSTSLTSLKSKVDQLDIDKLIPAPVDLSKLGDVVKNNAVKKTKYDELFKKVDAVESTGTSNLVKKLDYNTKINEI